MTSAEQALPFFCQVNLDVAIACSFADAINLCL
jgi:hypothetical protein